MPAPKPRRSVPAKGTGGLNQQARSTAYQAQLNKTWTRSPAEWQDLNGASKNRVGKPKKKK